MTNAAEHSARWILAVIGLAPRNVEELACVAGVLLAPNGSIAGFGVFTTSESRNLDATTRRLFGIRELGRLEPPCESRQAMVEAFRKDILAKGPVFDSGPHGADGSLLDVVLIADDHHATATGRFLEEVRGPRGPRPALTLRRLADAGTGGPEADVWSASAHLRQIDPDAPALLRMALALAAYYRYLRRAQPKPELTAADVTRRVAEWQLRLSAINDFMGRPR